MNIQARARVFLTSMEGTPLYPPVSARTAEASVKPSSSQNIVSRGLEDDGSSIILIDIIVLAVLLLGALIYSVFEIYRRRRCREERIKRNLLPLHSLGSNIESNTELSASAAVDIESGMDASIPEDDAESSHSRRSGSIELLMPLPSPPSPLLPAYPYPLITNRRRVSPTSPPLDPDLYGDPYPSPQNSIWPNLRKSRSRSSLFSNSRHSISSLISSKIGRATYGRFSRLSEESYPDDPALSDTRSNVLARELSRSTNRTALTRGNSFASRKSSDPLPPTDSNSPVDVPALPALVVRHGDL